MNFSAGGFLNHGAGCSGGYPAFYRLDGDRIAITRIEPIRIGKCAGTAELANGPASLRAAARDSEQRLADFLDRSSSWRREGDTLILTARDGVRAVLTRPSEPHPEIAGRWLIETIGGEPLVTDGPACADRARSFTPGEPVGIGGEISTLAVARPDGFGFNEQGRLVLRTGRGLLTMCRKGSPPPFGS